MLNALVDPGLPGARCPISWGRHVHGLEPNDVRGATTLRQAVAGVHALAERATLVAHNAPFERRHLQALRENRWVDTLRLARTRWPGLGSYCLSSLCDRFALDAGGHRALGDAWACAQLLARMLRT